MSNNIKGLLNQMNENTEGIQEADQKGDEVEEQLTSVEDVKTKEANRIWFSTAEAMEIIMGVLVNLFEKETEDDIFEEEEMGSDCDDEVEDSKANQAMSSTNNTTTADGRFVVNRVKQYLIN